MEGGRRWGVGGGGGGESLRFFDRVLHCSLLLVFISRDLDLAVVLFPFLFSV
jgi:hypothetical protein